MAKELTCIFTSVPHLEGENVANVANFQSVCLSDWQGWRSEAAKQPLADLNVQPDRCLERTTS